MNEKDFRSRRLHVRLSTPASVKRQATTIVSRMGKSPSVEPNGAPERSATPDANAPGGDRAARTLGLMNIPDTVNDARIRSLAEPFGPLVKIILRPDHRGAIVEFSDVNDAGKASLGLEGHEISPGRRIHVGSVNEMLRHSAEHKVDRQPAGRATTKTTPSVLQPGGPIKRPTQPGARGSGRRGGLGLKRGGGVAAVQRREQHHDHQATEASGSDSQAQPAKKSNDDFRAMIQGNEK
jgi:hypothetical protein